MPPHPTDPELLLRLRHAAVFDGIAEAATSRIDPGALAHRALELALSVVGADNGAVNMIQGAELALIARAGATQVPSGEIERVPLAASLSSLLMADPGARTWTLDTAPAPTRRFLASMGVRMIASAPLRSAGHTVGMLHFSRSESVPFTDEDLAFITLIATHLGPGLHASLLRSADPSEQGAAELRVLHRVAATVGHSLVLQEVLDASLDIADELVGASISAIFVLDETGHRLDRMAQRNVPPLLAPITAHIEGDALEALRAEAIRLRPVMVGLSQLTGPLHDVCVELGIVMALTIPLVANEVLVGIQTFAFPEARTFAPSTLDTLLAIGEQEAAAIDRARTHALAELRARVSNIVREVAERALATARYQDTVEVLLDGMVALCRSPGARLAMFDERGALISVGSRDLPPSFESELRHLGHDDPLIQAIFSSTDPIVLGRPEHIPAGSTYLRIFEESGRRSTVILPLRLRGQVVGTLACTGAEPRHYHSEELNAMRLLSSVAASALEADRLRREVEGQRNRLVQILELLPMPLSVIDVRGRLEEVNAAFRSFEPRFAKGVFYDDVAHDSGLFSRQGAPLRVDDLNVARCLRGEEPSPLELQIKTSRGLRRVISHAVSLRDADGAITGVVLANQDVTALHELAEAKDRFLDIISHELRSPLAALRACASLLDADPRALSTPERRAVLVGRIKGQVDRLVRFVDELVDTSRMRGGTLNLQRERMDLCELLREVADLTQLQTEQHDLVVEADAPVVGTWDRARLTQVVNNLLSNAIRYTPDGGEIVLTARLDAQRADQALLTVRDCGIGIPPAQQRRLFEPYFRGQEAGQLARGGLGLGLYIAMEIVRRHGGTIDVESEMGRGSRFLVTLPLEPTPAP